MPSWTNKIGKMRHRITVQERSTVSDSGGGRKVTWQDKVTLWAYVQPASASEKFFAARLRDEITHTVQLRHRTDLTTDMRFTYENRTFQIKGFVTPDEVKQFMIMGAIEGTAS